MDMVRILQTDFLNKEYMTKIEAICWLKKIQSGSGVDRTKFSNSMKGDVARSVWNDSLFTFGIEYGVMIALMKSFDITEEDLKCK